MSPQQHRGHSAPQGHKKPAPRPASAAAPKTATGASAAKPSATPQAAPAPAAAPAAAASTPSKSGSAPAAKYATDAGSEPKAAEQGRRRVKPSAPQTESRPTKRRGGLTHARRNPMLTGAWAYLKAFLPLILVVVIGSVGIIVWTTVTKAETPTEAWTRMETKWQPARDAALKEIVNAGTDAQAQVTGYQHLRDATRDWITDLGKITSWTDTAPSSAAAGESDKSVAQMISFGKQEADYIDGLTVANLSERLVLLYNYEDVFVQARDQARNLVMGSTGSPMPTLKAPPTAAPSASADASASAAATPAPSDTPVPTASPVPSAS